jgi:hypothetical protein
MKSNFKKINILIIILGIFFAPVLTFADDLTTNAPRAIVVPEEVAPRAIVVPEGAAGNPYQAQGNSVLTPNYISSHLLTGTSSSASTTSSTGATSAVTSAGGCFAGQALAGAITSAITGAVSTLASKATDSVTNVPVSENSTLSANKAVETQAHTGTFISIMGIPAAAIKIPSWDSIAYCIVNAMIIYIANSTIQWIKSGFNGNPAFLDHPDQFFKQLADEETSSFLQNLAYDITGVNVCNVFRASMVSAMIGQYNQQHALQTGYGAGRGINNGFLGCSFDQNPNQLNSFVKGNFIQGGGWNSWYNVTQNPKNNPYDTLFNTQARMNNQVLTAQASQQQQLGWSNGFLSFKQCDTKNQDPKTCKIVTPGNVIQNQLNTSLNLGKDRLVLADKFDQVVTALVNQLITTALGHVLEGSKK